MDKDTLKNLVESILVKDERARADDNWLWFKVAEISCKSVGRKMFIPFDIWEQIPKISSVFRCRQILQNVEKKWLPSDPEVRRKRRIAESEWLAWIRKQKN